MQATFIIQLINRIGSKSPRFFRTFQIVSIVCICFSAVTSWLIGKGLFASLDPKTATMISDICHDIAVFFGGTALASATGTTNPKLMDDTTKENVVEHHITEAGKSLENE